MTPLLSVIIPTHNRPQLLPRAINSALQAAPDGDVEVIVVPNGNDTSWQTVANEYQDDIRISWHYLDKGNACAARNYGISIAHGKYVRFLDDDDYLYQSASDQLKIMEDSALDVCTSPLEYIKSNENESSAIDLPNTDDFVSLVFLSMYGVSPVQGSVFRKNMIEGIAWREDLVLYDDYIFSLEIVGAREVKWARSANPVCAYVQHNSSRLSRIRRNISNSKPLVDAIINLRDKLSLSGRLTSERNKAASVALLTHAHSAFPSSPFYLGGVIKNALRMDGNAKPAQPLFQQFPVLADHLLVAEWSMLLPRYLSRSFRRLSWSTGRLLGMNSP